MTEWLPIIGLSSDSKKLATAGIVDGSFGGAVPSKPFIEHLRSLQVDVDYEVPSITQIVEALGRKAVNLTHKLDELNREKDRLLQEAEAIASEIQAFSPNSENAMQELTKLSDRNQALKLQLEEAEQESLTVSRMRDEVKKDAARLKIITSALQDYESQDGLTLEELYKADLTDIDGTLKLLA